MRVWCVSWTGIALNRSGTEANRNRSMLLFADEDEANMRAEALRSATFVTERNLAENAEAIACGTFRDTECVRYMNRLVKVEPWDVPADRDGFISFMNGRFEDAL